MDRKTSPLKAKPLRQAGQSVQEQIDKIIDEKVLIYIFVPILLISFAVMEWIRFKQQTPPSPYLITLTAIVVTIYCIYKVKKLLKDVKALKLGRDGEKAVGQYLEILREDGCIVFHDIVGDKFNIDHVVISEKGIYCIETKTYSKPKTEKPTVHYKKGILRIDSIGEKNKILNQVQAAATWLTRMLTESTGKEYQIKPVILFPGWWVDADDYKEIWVLEPKGFPKFLSNENVRITKEDKKLAAYHLSRYIRAL